MSLRPVASVKSQGRRHGWLHAPRLPLRPDIARERKQRPLYPTQIAPWTKTSTSAVVAAQMARISSSESALSRITRAKPASARKRAPSGVRFETCVEVHPPQGHVLHDEGIDPGVEEFAGLPFGVGELLVPEQRVERGVDPHAEAVGIRHDAGDLLRGVSGGLPRPEARAADVDGIGARIHGHDGRGVIPGRSQQFDGSHTD